MAAMGKKCDYLINATCVSNVMQKIGKSKKSENINHTSFFFLLE